MIPAPCVFEPSVESELSERSNANLGLCTRIPPPTGFPEAGKDRQRAALPAGRAGKQPAGELAAREGISTAAA